MKISEMILNLEKFKNKYGDLECWYAKDDEGNGYQKIHYTPSLFYVGRFNGEVYSNTEDIYNYDPRDIEKICIVN